MTRTLREQPWGTDVAQVLSAAIRAVDPYRVTARHINLEGEHLHLDAQTFPLRRLSRILVVGAGKAGLPMAQAAVDVLGSRIADGLVIVKEGYGGPGQVGAVRIREAGHPLPDERGLAATEELLALASSAGPDDLVLALISGGGSALLTKPAPGVSLADLQQLTDLLLASGAEIGEINRLRQRLDTVKGGGLARVISPGSLAALILSDVVGDPLELIASGPTVIAPVSRPDPMAIVRRYGLEAKLPDSVRTVLRRPPLPPFAPNRPNNILVGNNEIAARAALAKAQALGFRTELLTTSLQGEAREVGREYGRRLRRYAARTENRPALWVAGGETTVTIAGDGLGGRNQELALAAVTELDGLPDAALVTLATDGGDGPTDAAGAVVSGQTLSRARALGLDLEEYLANNDSHRFFRQLGDCLTPGPTRTNVNDLLFLFCF